MAKKTSTNTTTTTKTKKTALARSNEAVRLTKQERSVLEEAIRRGTDFAEEVEAQVMSYGRWLLETIFENDAARALDDKTHNTIWMELVRRAGGPTLRVSRTMLYTALGLAARDKRITDQAWRNLDAPRKELLLPLKDDDEIREAAQHVSKFNLTQKATREYVTELLSERNDSRQVRVTPARLVRRVRTLRDSLGGAMVLRRVRDFHEELDASERAAVAAEIDKLKDVLASLSRVLRRR